MLFIGSENTPAGWVDGAAKEIQHAGQIPIFPPTPFGRRNLFLGIAST
jgi:hypothetical protein